MEIELLIPTMNKSKEDLINLCNYLNVDSNVLFAVQGNSECEYSFNYKGYTIRVIETKTRGVSINRNILLKNANKEISVFLDDDCILFAQYKERILEAYKLFPNAQAIRFNAKSETPMAKYKKPLKNKRIGFFNLAGYGVCGFSFKTNDLRSQNVWFDEKVGVPNYISHGEDSIFLKEATKKLKFIYQSEFYLITIMRTEKESSWFKGFDDQFFITNGYIYQRIYGAFSKLFWIKSYLSNKKRYNRSMKNLFQLYKQGEKYFKDSLSE